jgi:F-type H+-transporting ATPase subunit epsilon
VKAFPLDIMTPKHRFYSGSVEVIIVKAPDGELAILAGHAPMIVALQDGSLRIKEDGNWREAFHSEGFIEVRPAGTVIFAQVCEWAEDIDVARANEEKRVAEEHLRQKQSITEHKASQINLARAMARLRITRHNQRMD